MNRREFIFAGAAAAVVPSVAGVDAPNGEYHAFSRVFQFLKNPRDPRANFIFAAISW